MENICNNKGNHEITDDEASLYDRQIRLWGVRSQKLIRAANVLCIGLSGLASEAVKNIGEYTFTPKYSKLLLLLYFLFPLFFISSFRYQFAYRH